MLPDAAGKQVNGRTWQWVVGGLAAAFFTISLTIFAILAALGQRLSRVEADRVTHAEHEMLQKEVYELNSTVAAVSVQIQINARRLDIVEDWMRANHVPKSGP